MKQTIIDAVKNAEGQRVHFSQLVTWDAFATREQVQAEPYLSIDEHDFVHYVSPKEFVKEVVTEAPVSVSSSHNAPVEVEVTDEERQVLVDPKDEFEPLPDEDEPKETPDESSLLGNDGEIDQESVNDGELSFAQVKEIVAKYNKQVMAKFEKENGNDLQKICNWLMARYQLSPLAEADGVYAFTATAHGATEAENIVICEDFTTAVEDALLGLYDNDGDIKVFCLKKTDDETRIRFFVKDVSPVLANLPSKKLESVQLEVFVVED